MSHKVNDELMELAGEHLEFWAGEGIGKAIAADVQRGDLEGLKVHLIESAKYMAELEGMEPGNFDMMTPERAEDMFHEATDAF